VSFCIPILLEQFWQLCKINRHLSRLVDRHDAGVPCAARSPAVEHTPPKLLIEVIAERIIVAATNGERDPVRLVESALGGVVGEED
jgi:hypothetical protein